MRLDCAADIEFVTILMMVATSYPCVSAGRPITDRGLEVPCGSVDNDQHQAINVNLASVVSQVPERKGARCQYQKTVALHVCVLEQDEGLAT